MRYSEALADFLAYATHEKGHSKTTLKCYGNRLRNFARWLAANGHDDPPVYAIPTPVLRKYYYHLSGAGAAGKRLRPRTLRGALHALRCFFAWAHEAGLIEEDPVREIKLPKLDAPIRKLAQDSELLAVLEATGNQASEFRCVRDRAVFATLIFCGVRRQELLDLEVDHVNLEDRVLLVQQGKGAKSRSVPLCPEVADALAAWLPVRQQQKPQHPTLFTIEGGRPLGDQSLTKLVNETKARAGFKDDPAIMPHSMRHACGTRLLRNGADLKSISVWLGHADLQTTSIYLHESEEQLRKVGPLASMSPNAPRKEAEEAPKPSRAELVRRHRQGR